MLFDKLFRHDNITKYDRIRCEVLYEDLERRIIKLEAENQYIKNKLEDGGVPSRI